MKYMYPKKNHYLIIKRNSRDSFNVKNVFTEDEWELGIKSGRFLKALDGYTDPYTIDPTLEDSIVEYLLKEMDRVGLLDSKKRIIPLGIGSVLIPLWAPDIKLIHRLLGAVWNRILMISWLPLLIIGLYVFLYGSWNYIEKECGILTGYILGFGMGLLFHELSHAAACIGYGSNCHFLEMGISTYMFLPGAYVLLDYSELKKRFKRVQINAAGIECNAALCGILFCALRLEWFDSYALILAALLNGILAIMNATLIEGLDGMSIFQEIIGCENLVERTKSLVFSKESKRLLRKRGINGSATIVASYIIVFLQVLLPIVLVMNVISIVGIFI